jgi:ATP-binding cassette subfamily B (MDR/TAP) protein 1
MSAKIAKEIMAIQRGSGEKVGNTIMSCSMFFLGFAFAFYFGWKLTVILMGVMPVLMFMGIGFSMALESGVVA